MALPNEETLDAVLVLIQSRLQTFPDPIAVQISDELAHDMALDIVIGLELKGYL